MPAIGIRSLVIAAIGGIAAVAASQPAAATPFIDVTAIWEEGLVSLSGAPVPLPSGLSITCTGDASPGGIGCRDTLTVDHAVTSDETVSVSHSGGLLLTNTGATTFTGTLPFEVGISAFNPGGPDVGISIDNASQSASYSSFAGGDQHSCSLPASSLGFTGPPDNGFNFSAFQCGVLSPDESSFYDSIFISLLPGQSQDIVVQGIIDRLSITDTFAGIPEPSFLGIMAPAMLALGLLRRRWPRQ